MINYNATALSMGPFELEAGTAASLYGFIQWGIAGLVSIVISAFKSTSAVPLSGILTGTALLAIIVLTSGRRVIALKTLQN